MNNWQKEIEELHEFFCKWYRGEVPEDTFHRISDTLANEFNLVTSEGFVVGREVLFQGLKSQYGTKPDMEMKVENIQLRFSDDNIFLATYEEWGQSGDFSKRTMISAVLRYCPEKPNNLEWLHIHESLMPE